MKVILAGMPLVAAQSLSRRTAERAYYAAQGWQRNQCSELPEKSEFDRCMRDTDTTYDSYRRQRESERH